MELTEWYPAYIKPVREGVYEVKSLYGDVILHSKWNGRYWMWVSPSQDAAAIMDAAAPFQDRRWRGLSSDPKQVSTL